MAARDPAEAERSNELIRKEYQAQIHLGYTLYRLQRLFWADFGPSHVPVRKDKGLIAANFPDVNTRLVSPAFDWPHTVPPGFQQGSESPTDQHIFERFVQQIASTKPWIQIKRTNFESGEGRNLMYLILSNSTDRSRSTLSQQHKLRVWIQSGVHGNEPAGDQAVFALLGKLDSDAAWTAHILSAMDILLLPCYNLDGIADFNRPCTMGFDLNRDHISLRAPESRGIRQLFCTFQPHIALDMHEYSAKARFEKYIHGSDVMFSAAKNLNIHPAIRKLSEDLFATEIGDRLDRSLFRWEPYTPTTGSHVLFREAGSDGKIGRNAMGLTQCVSFLCETRGIGIGDQHFQRRTAAGLKFIECILEIATTNVEIVYRTLQDAMECFVEGTSNIIVKDTSIKQERMFTMIDIENGNLVKIPVQFMSTTPTIPTLVRGRPEAYAIPPSMSHVVDLLVKSGLEIQELRDTWTGQAEVLTIETARLGTTYFEGIVPMTVTTTCTTKSISLPQRTSLISTRQKNAALAFIALEPENVDSYISSNIISAIPGDEYPIVRLMADMPI